MRPSHSDLIYFMVMLICECFVRNRLSYIVFFLRLLCIFIMVCRKLPEPSGCSALKMYAFFVVVLSVPINDGS